MASGANNDASVAFSASHMRAAEAAGQQVQTILVGGPVAFYDSQDGKTLVKYF